MPNTTEKAQVIPIDTAPEKVREAFVLLIRERIYWKTRARLAVQENVELTLQIREMQADARHSRLARRWRNKLISTALVIGTLGYVIGLAWNWWTL